MRLSLIFITLYLFLNPVSDPRAQNTGYSAEVLKAIAEKEAAVAKKAKPVTVVADKDSKTDKPKEEKKPALSIAERARRFFLGRRFFSSKLDNYGAANKGLELSEKYNQGSFLIYDCKDSHWVCVVMEQFNDCKKQRDNEKENLLTEYSCAPLKEYSTKKDCFKAQKKLINSRDASLLCKR